MKTIFVSSTFRDFQQERDALHDRVLPIINEQGRKYGEEVSFCDLRWGVDTSGDMDEDASSEKVLSVCMNEIDRSRPYMIVMLGERYGFMPGETAIEREVKRKKMELEQLEISVTALEIEYGALHNLKNLENTWFYFRELESEEELPAEYLPESTMHEQKLNELKERIRAVGGDRIRFYKASWKDGQVTGLDDFVEQVSRDIKGQLQIQWEVYEHLHPYEKDSLNQWNYLQGKAGAFTVFSEFADQVVRHLQGDNPITIVSGASGSGKSTLFAKVCQDMQKQGYVTIPIFCGHTSLSTDAFEIMKNLVWQLETLLGVDHFAKEVELKTEAEESAIVPCDKWRERLDELCVQATENQRILIAVDALDQLQGGGLLDYLEFLPSVHCDRLRIFLTCLDTFEMQKQLKRITMPIMDASERRQVVAGVLASVGKELSAPVIHALVAREQGNTPLYLYMEVSRLTLMNAEDFQNIRNRGDGMDAITARQLELVEQMPDTTEQMCVALIDAVGARVNSDMVEKVLAYLAISRHGLRVSDLKELLAVDEIDFRELEFAQLVNYMNELFILRADGRYDFLHKSLRAGILDKLRKQGVDEREMHQKLVDYFETLPEDDVIRIQEMTWECIQADDRTAFMYWLSVVWHESKQEKVFVRDCIARCREDDGAWLFDYLEHVRVREYQEESNRELAVRQGSFVTAMGICRNLGSTLRDNQTAVRLIEKVVSNMEWLVEQMPTYYNRYFLVTCFKEAATHCMQSEIVETREKAFTLLQQAIQLLKEIIEEDSEEKKVSHYRWMYILYTILANAYFARKDAENLQLAMQCAEEALRYSEESDTAESDKQRDIWQARSVVASIAHMIGDEASVRRSYELTLLSAEELNKKDKSEYTIEDLETQVIVYASLTVCCSELTEHAPEEFGDLRLDYARKALVYAREYDRIQGSILSKECLAKTLLNSGRVYALCEDHVEAKRCFEEAIQLREELATELGTPQARYELANLYGVIGESMQSLKEDVEYTRKGERVARYLSEEVPIYAYQDSWEGLNWRLCKILREYADELWNTEKTAERDCEIKACLEEAIACMKRWNQEKLDDKDFRQMSFVYNRMGRWYLEEERELSLAQQYFGKALELSRQLLTDTLYAKKEVMYGYSWMGETLEAYGDEPHLYEAMSYYRKYMTYAQELAEVEKEKAAEAVGQALKDMVRVCVGIKDYKKYPFEREFLEQMNVWCYNVGEAYVDAKEGDRNEHLLQAAFYYKGEAWASEGMLIGLLDENEKKSFAKIKQNKAIVEQMDDLALSYSHLYNVYNELGDTYRSEQIFYSEKELEVHEKRILLKKS